MTLRLDSVTLVVDTFDNGMRRVIRIDVPAPLRAALEREVRTELDAHAARMTAAAEAVKDAAGTWFV